MIRFFRKLAKAICIKNYRPSPHPPLLSRWQRQALNLGAINAEQTGCYCDDLQTGLHTADLTKELAKHYRIFSADDALAVLNWLLQRGHCAVFDAIVHQQLSALDDKEAETADAFQQNIRDTAQTLMQHGYINSMQDFAQCSIKAWDLGRLVFVARCAYQCGYLSQAQAWAYLTDALAAAHSQFSSWADFAGSYVLGRAVAFGDSVMLPGIIQIAQALQTDLQSPWQQLPFGGQ